MDRPLSDYYGHVSEYDEPLSPLTTAVVQLREKTGRGLMDCKKALLNSNMDEDAAIQWLRDNPELHVLYGGSQCYTE